VPMLATGRARPTLVIHITAENITRRLVSDVA
jgi:hypothetical protein